MQREIDALRAESVLLRDDSLGVATERKPRKIQKNGESAYRVTLAGGWVQQLNLDSQSDKTLHSLSLGMRPVIVQRPAIIIQPAAMLGGEFDG